MDDNIVGRARGGMARAEALSPEQRREIARNAAVSRWGQKTLQATHKGNFQRDFGIDVECYVLNDEQKTAVISQRGMGEALGLGQGGSRLPRFINREKMSPYIGRELSQKLENPIVFQSSQVGPNVHGYDVTILIDICKAVIKAQSDGALGKRQDNIVNQANIIVNASAKAGIKGLVYALSGYDATKEEVVAAFKFYVREEARDYEKEFPRQLYAEWYRLYQIPRPERNNPWKFMHLTLRQVYTPLARSNGRILQLTQAQRTQSAERHKKLHQFLSDIGVKALRQHLGQLLGIAQISNNQEEYERYIRKVFGDQHEMDF
jgi:hypothetical protein